MKYFSGLVVVLNLLSSASFAIHCEQRIVTNGEAMSDRLVYFLKKDVVGFRNGLFRQAASHHYQLNQVLMPETLDTARWMRSQLKQVLKLLRDPSRDHWKAIDVRRGFVEATARRVEDFVGVHSYTGYNRLAPIFAKSIEMLDPNESVIPFRDFPDNVSFRAAMDDGVRRMLTTFGYDSFFGPSSRAFLKENHRLSPFEVPVFDLLDYVMLPIRQEFLNAAFTSDDFLRAFVSRIYYVGILPLDMSIPPELYTSFGQVTSDNLYARDHYKKFYLRKKAATNDAWPKEIREYYRDHLTHEDQHFNAYVRAKERVTEEPLKRMIEALSWSMFHEKATVCNPLDAYMFVKNATANPARGGFPAVEELAKTYYDQSGRFQWLAALWNRSRPNVAQLRARAIQWHLEYWRGVLPRGDEYREQLIQQHFRLER